MLSAKFFEYFPRPEFLAGDRAVGMLVGSLLGDAIGGPLEFANEEKRKGNVVGARQWDDSKVLDDETIASMARDAKLMSYEKVRPGVEAYGQWIAKAPAGTLTDDSRWKIILIRAIRNARAKSQTLSQAHIAESIRDFQPIVGHNPDKEMIRLIEEGLLEYRYAANWILGVRDESKALPLDRLWAGIPNCSGQMMLLPLAIRYAGDPESAYRESYRLNFIDSAGAKDIASMLVAAIASVLGEEADKWTIQRRWETVEETLRTLDPFRLKKVPFAGRPLDKWLTLVDSIVEKSNGKPVVAYRLLETEAKPVYFWDAHFTMIVALTMLKLCKFNPMCSLSMAIDFGHDTDSYAQLIGAFAGAVGGVDAFPEEMRTTVSNRLKDDFGEDVRQWVKLLRSREKNR
jgi:ADP-ribosylglycohydrolase